MEKKELNFRTIKQFAQSHMRAESRLKSGADIQIHFLKCNIYCCHKQIHYMIKKYMQFEKDEVSRLNPQRLSMAYLGPKFFTRPVHAHLSCILEVKNWCAISKWVICAIASQPVFSFLTSSGLIQYFFSIPFYLYPLFSHSSLFYIVSGGFRAVLSNRLVCSYVSI